MPGPGFGPNIHRAFPFFFSDRHLLACSFALVVIDCFQTDVEHDQLSRIGRLDAVLVHERQDAVTDFREFRLDIRGVLPRVLLVLRLLLLHTDDGAPSCVCVCCSTLTADGVLVSDGSLCKLLAHSLRVLHHLSMVIGPSTVLKMVVRHVLFSERVNQRRYRPLIVQISRQRSAQVKCTYVCVGVVVCVCGRGGGEGYVPCADSVCDEKELRCVSRPTSVGSPGPPRR